MKKYTCPNPPHGHDENSWHSIRVGHLAEQPLYCVVLFLKANELWSVVFHWQALFFRWFEDIDHYFYFHFFPAAHVCQSLGANYRFCESVPQNIQQGFQLYCVQVAGESFWYCVSIFGCSQALSIVQIKYKIFGHWNPEQPEHTGTWRHTATGTYSE